MRRRPSGGIWPAVDERRKSGLAANELRRDKVVDPGREFSGDSSVTERANEPRREGAAEPGRDEGMDGGWASGVPANEGRREGGSDMVLEVVKGLVLERWLLGWPARRGRRGVGGGGRGGEGARRGGGGRRATRVKLTTATAQSGQVLCAWVRERRSDSALAWAWRGRATTRLSVEEERARGERCGPLTHSLRGSAPRLFLNRTTLADSLRSALDCGAPTAPPYFTFSLAPARSLRPPGPRLPLVLALVHLVDLLHARHFPPAELSSANERAVSPRASSHDPRPRFLHACASLESVLALLAVLSRRRVQRGGRAVEEGASTKGLDVLAHEALPAR